MKVLVLVGTRPEAIKLAPVVKELRRRAAERRLETTLCATGQHREMARGALALFGLAPDVDLDLMTPDQAPAEVAGAVLTRLSPLLAAKRPDWVLVQGDTVTAAAAAWAAFLAGSRVAHVEAGLRSGDKRRPFPEEVNRRLAAVAADLHFAPTAGCRANLLAEGVPGRDVRVTGNTGIDALLWAAAQPARAASPAADGRPLVLVTAHRRESFGRPLAGVLAAVRRLARRHPGVRFFYPLHPNPHVERPARRALGGLTNVALSAPVDYVTMAGLLKECRFVLTDSGGLQEEAPALGKPVLVLREVTERPEVVAAGAARLVGTEPAAIVREASRLLTDAKAYAAMAKPVSPYGDGRAARRVVAALLGERAAPFRPRPGAMIAFAS